MSEHNFENLKSHILPLSKSEIFNDAKKNGNSLGLRLMMIGA
jgi:hypothetical protein